SVRQLSLPSLIPTIHSAKAVVGARTPDPLHSEAPHCPAQVEMSSSEPLKVPASSRAAKHSIMQPISPPSTMRDSKSVEPKLQAESGAVALQALCSAQQVACTQL